MKLFEELDWLSNKYRALKWDLESVIHRLVELGYDPILKFDDGWVFALRLNTEFCYNEKGLRENVIDVLNIEADDLRPEKKTIDSLSPRMDLNEELKILMGAGYKPVVQYRDKGKWRASLFGFSNIDAEASSPIDALNIVINREMEALSSE